MSPFDKSDLMISNSFLLETFMVPAQLFFCFKILGLRWARLGRAMLGHVGAD